MDEKAMADVEKADVYLNYAGDLPKVDSVMRTAAVTSNDPMSDVLSHPYLAFTGSIQANSNVNSVIYETPVSPLLFRSTSSTRISVMAQLFRQWSGEMTVRFRCTKTIYVEGKLIMAFLPGLSIEQMQSVSISDMLSQEASCVINLVNDDCVDFTIPFVSTDIFREVSASTGIFSIRCFLPLVASVTSAPAVPFSLEIYSKKSRNGLCFRYLSTLSSSGSSVSSFTNGYDLFNTIDTERGLFTTVYGPTVPTAPIQTAIGCPTSTFLAGVNSAYPFYGLPDAHWASAGNITTTPVYYSYNSNEAKALRRFLSERRQVKLSFNVTGTSFTTILPSAQNRRESVGYINNTLPTSSTLTGVTVSAGVSQRPMVLEIPTPFNFYFGTTLAYGCVVMRNGTHRVVVSGKFSVCHFYSQAGGGSVRISTGHGATWTQVSQVYNDGENLVNALPTSGVYDTAVLLDRFTPPNLLNVGDQNFHVADLWPKLRSEVAAIPAGFDQVLIFSVGNIQDATNMLNLWLDSTSYSHSEQLAFNTTVANGGRGERRDQQNSWFDTFTSVVSDVISAGHVIGDVISTAGNILSFLTMFAANGLSVGGSNPIFWDITNPTSPIRFRVNVDKTILHNSNLSDANRVERLTQIRASQVRDTNPLVVANLSRETYIKRRPTTNNDSGIIASYAVNQVMSI